MKTFMTVTIIMVFLFALGAAKVLLRTNLTLGLSILAGCGLVLVLCWYFYPIVKGQ